jgi:hypothetical protein
MLGYVDGNTHDLGPWSDEALAAIGRLLRGAHDASATYEAPADAIWCSSFQRRLPSERLIIGHGDPAPWNIVARGGLPIAFIDWDYAGPMGAVWDLAHAAWLNVQLHDDDVAEMHALGGPEERARQLRVFVDAYGLPFDEREAFVARIAEFAVHSAREEALVHKVDPSTTSGITGAGYPFLWALAWRARSASWILRHREILQDSLLAQ